MDNREFNRRLRQRGLTVERLAELITSGRAHLTQVLNGSRPGTHTWKRLAKSLTKEEYDLARSYAAERQIASASFEGTPGAETWVLRNRKGAVVPAPVLWPEEITEGFLAEKKIPLLANPIA